MADRAQALHILYTADLHGQVSAMPYLATAVRDARAAHPGALLLDAGDWARGSPISDAWQGKPMIDIMNEMGYTAAGLGEGDTAWGLPPLLQRASEARFPLLAANLRDGAGRPLPAFTPFTVLEHDGLRLGITGLCCPDAARADQAVVLPPLPILRQMVVAMHAAGADVLIVLSHLGIEADRELAAAVPGLHCIIGGHSHLALSTPERVGTVLLAHAGQNAQNLGVLTLQIAASDDPETAFASPESAAPSYLFDPQAPAGAPAASARAGTDVASTAAPPTSNRTPFQ